MPSSAPDGGDGASARRVAVLADVHGNATALEAVLADAESVRPDLLVHCGDLTWGPQPLETIRLLDAWDGPVLYVRGNADRALVELAGRLAADAHAEVTPREAWMVESHGVRGRGLLATFPERVTVRIDGLGVVLFCHGSPRSDEELITCETPEARLADALQHVEADVVVTAHTHVRYERVALGRRLLNPGSVGMPYEGEPGAYWAILGPAVEFRRSEYDVERAAARYRTSGDPLAEEMVEMLVSPPMSAEVVEHAERLAFSGCAPRLPSPGWSR
jgi:putative phosphoesterase